MKLLIISHDASRTGAPILLLNLAAALKSKGMTVDFLLKRGGSLEADFRALGTATIYFRTESRSLLNRVRRKLFPQRHADISGLPWSSYDLVLSNTITNGDLLPEVRRHYRGPILSYIHELEMAARFFTNPRDEQSLVQHTDLFATPCHTVRRFITNRYGLKDDMVKVLPYHIPARGKTAAATADKGTTFFAGGAGTVDWRKSPDLFVQAAIQVFAQRPDADIRFVWKGAPDGGTDLERVRYDIRKAGLEDRVDFLPASADMPAFYRSLDVFLLTSREDPYPLVVLEAADANVPTICFAGAGGATEFVEESGGGLCVPYADTAAMARTILAYYDERAHAHAEGERARDLLVATHQNVDYIINQFESILKPTREHAL